MTGSLFHYQAMVTNVVDGDTLDVEFDLGFRLSQRWRVRLHGVDTPDPCPDSTTEWVRQWIDARPWLVIKTFRDKLRRGEEDSPEARNRDKRDSFGRVLAIVWGLGADMEWESLNQRLLETGLAVPYEP